MSISVVVVMGVSGSGKSTVGQLAAARLQWPFFDADSYHPQTNIDKMAAGFPLNDDDRRPWLVRLNGLILEHLRSGRSLVLACSALKQSYRKILFADVPSTSQLLVHLDGSFELIWSRMATRKDHFMKPAMLASQFATLEPPEGETVLRLDISGTPDALVAQLIQALDA